MLSLTLENDRWLARSPYGDWRPKQAGFRWDPKVKAWWTEDPIKALRLEFAGSEDVKKTIHDAIEAKRKTEQKSLEQSRATDATIDIPSPEGLEYLPYQKAGIQYALSRDATLIGDEMGLGKTIQAIGVINALPETQRTLVICPASLKLNWKQELDKWLVKPYMTKVAKGSYCPSFKDNIVTIVNYDILKRHHELLCSIDWDIMIIDEVHYLKNYKAQRTKFVFGGKNIKPITAKRRLYLTGTPISNRPIELFPILKSINKKEWGNWVKFVETYCNGYRTDWGWEVGGASNLDELQDRLRATCMIRRLKVDVLKDLPSKRRQVIQIESGKNKDLIEHERKVIQENQQTIKKLKDSVEKAKITGTQDEYDSAVRALRQANSVMFTEIAKARHDVALAKVPFVIDWIKESLETGHKVVVFAHHLDVIDAMYNAFDPSTVVKLDGRDSMESRDQAVKQFQNNPACKVFIGGIKAAGVGLTLTASSHVIFAELDWVPGALSQAEDRCHRIGQENSVLVQHLVMQGSIDANMAFTVIAKQNVIDQALDNETDADARVERQEEELNWSFDDISNDGLIDFSPHPEKPAVTRSVSYKKITEEAENLTPDQIKTYHEGVKLISGACDGAARLDGAGFNKNDVAIGKSLANAYSLTPRQGVIAKKLCKRYHRQLTLLDFQGTS